MDDQLSQDEFDALDEIANAAKGARPSACVGRNSKRLVGIKLVAHRKDGSFQLTEKGVEAIFVKKCIATLRKLGTGETAISDSKISVFLGRKGYAAAAAQPGAFVITAKGRECLADIALSAKKK